MKSMIGCPPMLIQMPILFGLYTSLKWPVHNHLSQYPHFLWFDLSKPDIYITIIAGILYFIQSLVTLDNMPQEQKQVGYMMMIISPIFIIYISFTSASALGLYWSINALFLIVKMYFANKYYSKVEDNYVESLEKQTEKITKKDTHIRVPFLLS